MVRISFLDIPIYRLECVYNRMGGRYYENIFSYFETAVEYSRTLIYSCVKAFRADIFVIPDLYYVNDVHDLYIGNEFFY